jgi:UDP-GlcNAc:undecaprenyl-phosphate GlcNAc-1-phosphate transferase
MIYFGAVSAALVSFILTWWLRSYSLKRKVGLAPIRERDLHQKPIPRIGGVAVVISFLVVMVVLAALTAKSNTDFGFPFAIFGLSIDKRLLGIILATIFLSGIMLIDDLKGLKPFTKLAVQGVSALILIASGIGITYINNPFGLVIILDSIKIPVQIGASVYHIVFWADLLFMVWFFLLTNATNFIDGLDGLATTLAAIAAITLLFVSRGVGQNATALMSAVFAGALIGFLPFNLPRAKIFLGDTGSMFIGLMLAVLTIISGGKLATVLLVFGLVIIDALYVIAKRIIRGKNPFSTADQTHLHHRFLQAGFSPASTLIIISVISVFFALAALMTANKMKIFTIGILAVFSIVLFITLDLLKSRRSKNAD